MLHILIIVCCIIIQIIDYVYDGKNFYFLLECSTILILLILSKNIVKNYLENLLIDEANVFDIYDSMSYSVFLFLFVILIGDLFKDVTVVLVIIFIMIMITFLYKIFITIKNSLSRNYENEEINLTSRETDADSMVYFVI